MQRSMVFGSFVLAGLLALGRATAQEGFVEPALGELDSRPLRQVIAGRVCLPDGSPAAGAVVVTSAGGQFVTGADGSFALEVELPAGEESVEVTAVVDARSGSGSLVASARFVPAALAPTLSTGTLALTLAPTCAPRWLPTFGSLPGTNNSVHALAVFDDGSGPALHVAGGFNGAGGAKILAIAKWDGSRWAPLGSGILDGFVHALVVHDDGSGPALFVGGSFVEAGGEEVSGIAKWDGASWSDVGGGISTGGVRALAVYDDGSGPALYAGAFVGSAGGATGSGVSKWDGSSWSAVGTMNAFSDVRALAVHDDGSGAALYAGGTFTAPGNRIARWDGSTWKVLGTGMTGDAVETLAVYDDGGGPALYAGGNFAGAGGVQVNRVARWKNGGWTALGSGVEYQFGSAVVGALAVYDDGSGPALHVGGTFTSAGGLPANHLAKWDGASWAALPSQLSERVYALAAFDDGSGPALFAGGAFFMAGTQDARHIARWDGTSWTALGEQGCVSSGVFALEEHDAGGGAVLAAAGDFLTVGGVTANRIATWDGSGWTALGSGVNGQVLALETYDDGGGPGLYAGGLFTLAGGATANYVARWNGSSWSAPAGGMSGGTAGVQALAVHDDGTGPALFAGGGFTSAGGVAASRIARWDGSSWSALGSGLNAEVYALAVYDDGGGPELYAGGLFFAAGGVNANRIAKWDGTSWSALGSGMTAVFTPSVRALAVHDDGSGPALYAAGVFTSVGGVPAQHVARWDGSGWTALGAGLGSGVEVLFAHDHGNGPLLYAGGSFGRRFARWDGSLWTTMGLEMNGAVEALASFDDGDGPALFVGGSFTSSPAGDSHLAKFGCRPKPTSKPRKL